MIVKSFFALTYFPSTPLSKGDMILTGTSGGVKFNVPRWKARLANLVRLDRFQKLAVSQKKNSAEKFLNVGNEVRLSAAHRLAELNPT
jgi:2-keto-4-pentenoate hydratase/2-oxohepta-3-ene-1,7-dioic acid hydratase in catechol pathway